MPRDNWPFAVPAAWSASRCYTPERTERIVTRLLADDGCHLVLVNPDRHTELPPGSVLYHVGRQRRTPEQVTQALGGG